MISPPKPQPPRSRPAYVDVERLKNALDMVAVISQRSSNGMLTFSIFREFPRNGVMDRTGFIPEDAVDEFMELAKLTIERMRQLRESGKLPYPVLHSGRGT